MDKFQTLLQKARSKGYKSFNQEHPTLLAEVFECIFICTWLRVKTKTDLELIFIEGCECEEQIDIMLEEMEKI